MSLSTYSQHRHRRKLPNCQAKCKRKSVESAKTNSNDVILFSMCNYNFLSTYFEAVILIFCIFCVHHSNNALILIGDTALSREMTFLNSTVGLSPYSMSITNGAYEMLKVKVRTKRQRHNNHHHHNSNNNNDLSLWIDESQVRMFSGGNNGFPMEIQAITDGHVLPYILDPNFENYLPVIPSEVGVVNFTWRAGEKKYFYNFDRLQSFDEDILLPPILSIETRGKIPKRAKSFSVFLPCSGLKSGIASFTVGLLIETRKGKPLNGTPLRLKLRKECFERNPDTECNKKCGNGGWCNNEKTCQCKEGYMGRYCETALCYPQCMNGGTCNEPGKCSCLNGFHGQFCEGGICRDKCLNNGKCIQKDTCECTRGYYGLRCEYSKCMIPCLNGGRCRGVNTCRCPATHSGDHCEIQLTSSYTSNNNYNATSMLSTDDCRTCRNGVCARRCQKRSVERRNKRRKT